MRIFLIVSLVLELVVILLISLLWGISGNYALQQLQPTLYYYSRTDDSNYGDVFLISSSDGSMRKLLDGDGSHAYQDLKPNADGSRYAVAYGNDIWIYDSKSGDGRRITNFYETKNSVSALQPTWSPDEQWIAFVVSSNTGEDLSDDGVWIVRTDGSKLEKIAPGAGLPRWRSDGQIIMLWTQNDVQGYYTGSIEKRDWELYYDKNQDLYYAPDGQRHILTDFFKKQALLYKTQDDPSGVNIMPTVEEGEANPENVVWSLDGEKFLLTLQHSFEKDGQPMSNKITYLIDKNGKQVAFLNERACSQTPVYIISLRVIGFSPDGENVALRGNCMGEDTTEIFMYDMLNQRFTNTNITDNLNAGAWWPMLNKGTLGLPVAWLAFPKVHLDLILSILVCVLLVMLYTSIAFIQQVQNG